MEACIMKKEVDQVLNPVEHQIERNVYLKHAHQYSQKHNCVDFRTMKSNKL